MKFREFLEIAIPLSALWFLVVAGFAGVLTFLLTIAS